MWILVLSILGSSSQSGQAVTGVPGFATEVACMTAANAWLKQTASVDASGYRRALCVKSQ